jgi:hypothetical protein
LALAGAGRYFSFIQQVDRRGQRVALAGVVGLVVLNTASRERRGREWHWVCLIDISQYSLLFGLSLLYTDHVPFELLGSAALLYEGRAAAEGAK